MKIELPLAILLLACGFMIWNWKRVADPPSKPEKSASPSSSLNSLWLPASVRKEEPQALSVDCDELFVEAIRQLRYSPPLRAKLELSVNLFDETMTMSGVYSQAGEGTPNARLDIESDGEGTGLQITQAFDGRFYYYVESADNHRLFRFVDLNEVTRLGAAKVNTVAGVKGWFGTGGVVPLLEQLSSSFEFEALGPDLALEREIPGLETIRFLGKWKRDSLHQLLRDQVEPMWIDEPIAWERLPGQLPHAVSITLGRTESMPYFPFRLAFLRTTGNQANSGEAYSAAVQYHVRSLVAVDEFPSDWFRVSAEGFDPEDMTADYLARIRMFLYHPVKQSK